MGSPTQSISEWARVQGLSTSWEEASPVGSLYVHVRLSFWPSNLYLCQKPQCPLVYVFMENLWEGAYTESQDILTSARQVLCLTIIRTPPTNTARHTSVCSSLAGSICLLHMRVVAADMLGRAEVVLPPISSCYLLQLISEGLTGAWWTGYVPCVSSEPAAYGCGETLAHVTCYK